ncbi:hypothetical protein PAP_05075 [Palaeococcus pacificus DY20341]|uniref:DUF112 domain-containing protein n=1 Tax=Palaeococcus pacificus DY20341 TaxID=1343739 RepID=A0A075LTH1_9EURY|nr:tripartite tricarboxylate transporter permease [Palaeococcus pacificus]AIF69426.1 hypothetical protein PAP_05075 [Palaeococcus pacificus DY20341]
MLKEFFLGLLGGTLSGVTPALHVNTLGALLSKLNTGFGSFEFVLLVYVMGLTHTFLDAIPSTFLGVPEEDTSLSVLPAHKLVLQGKGLEVINIALTSSMLAVLFSIPLIPIYSTIASLYKPEIGKLFVLILAIFLILTEKGIKKLYALLIFLFAGTLGILIDELPLKEPYFHIFVGLFGVPAILLGMKSKKVEIGDERIEMSKWSILGFSLLGTFLGALASLLPAFTSSQAALIGSFFSKEERSFLTIVFSVNTANFFFSMENFYLTERARNGILILVKEAYPILNQNEFLMLVLSSLATAFVVVAYGLGLTKILGGVMLKVDYKKLSLGTLAFIAILSLYFDGILGLFILSAASLIGYTAVVLGVKRTNCMGVLMLKILIK